MNELGRNRKVEDAQLALLERIAKGVERLAEDPVLEMEVGPPVCPCCGKFNPVVTTNEIEGTGRIFEFFVQMHCSECGKDFYAAPVQWSMHVDTSTLRAELQERADNFNGLARDNSEAGASR